jgi:hypothetical protein
MPTAPVTTNTVKRVGKKTLRRSVSPLVGDVSVGDPNGTSSEVASTVLLNPSEISGSSMSDSGTKTGDKLGISEGFTVSAFETKAGAVLGLSEERKLASSEGKDGAELRISEEGAMVAKTRGKMLRAHLGCKQVYPPSALGPIAKRAPSPSYLSVLQGAHVSAP